MADVDNIDLVLFLQHTVDDPIYVRLATVQQMPELLVLRNHGASVWMFFQGENGPLEIFVPAEGRGGFAGVNVVEEQSQIALGSGHESNEISHAFS
jgi:hypothetical protein